MRGTKRVCQACAARFYDLAREPIVCPSCGAQQQPEASAADAASRAAGYTDKTSWRSRPSKRPDPAPEPDADLDGAAEVTADADSSDQGPAANDDVVLDEEADDGDLSGLLDHREAEPGER